MPPDFPRPPEGGATAAQALSDEFKIPKDLLEQIVGLAEQQNLTVSRWCELTLTTEVAYQKRMARPE